MRLLTNYLLESGVSTTAELPVQEELPEKILQFGQGNFLRGYIDWMIHQMNKQGLFNGKVVVVQPLSQGPTIPLLNQQNGLFTVVLRGVQNGNVIDKSEVISSISRGLNAKLDWQEVLKVGESQELEFIFSNTTEAGITYVEEDYVEGEAPLSFPGKLTDFLYHRFKAFEGDSGSGLIVIPCELIEKNGLKLREFVLKKADDWNLPAEFKRWVSEHNEFCNTLVDRIVTGFPNDNLEEFHSLLGYKDNFITVGEPYHMFAIEGSEAVQKKLPLHRAGLNVKWGDITSHRELKVRLLNGPHTMLFAVSYLYGVDTVLEAMKESTLRQFVELGFQEIAPTVEAEEKIKISFMEDVKERFLNPYNKHYLTDIGLNAVYKFQTRLLPTLHRYTEKNRRLPQAIVFSLAALIAYYRPVREKENPLIGLRKDGQEYTMRENEKVTAAFVSGWENVTKGQVTIAEFVQAILADQDFWGEDLTELDQLAIFVGEYLTDIISIGMKESVEKFVQNTYKK
ncbi:tagaturonate reductase [Evansella tamaricis]|uniref:Tagaturonate reductase n=1 Tax=Evansella tamaricis TaxID=2069301 RepID=A0ABS6JD67_9BACI|nr:tagaturonate reductase [Evansella tamaricis]MBU9711616.1 tagaturonate reductase [Evansella tamaricis]